MRRKRPSYPPAIPAEARHVCDTVLDIPATAELPAEYRNTISSRRTTQRSPANSDNPWQILTRYCFKATKFWGSLLYCHRKLRSVYQFNPSQSRISTNLDPRSALSSPSFYVWTVLLLLECSILISTMHSRQFQFQMLCPIIPIRIVKVIRAYFEFRNSEHFICITPLIQLML